MRDLKLDGVPVSTSGLTQKTHKAAYCDLLLTVTAENLDKALKKYRQAGSFSPYCGLSISGVKDLGFLEEFPNTLYLVIRSDKAIKLGALEAVCNLRGLHFELPGAGIDFSWFPELEVYTGGWHKGHVNFDRCRLLRQLRLWKFNPDSNDLSTLANIRRLEDLEIVQSTITSLDGVETLEDLRILDFAYTPKLRSLAALKKCEDGLRTLSFERSKNLQSYRPLASLTRLKDLRLSSCMDMPNLKWTRGMDALEFFSFVETNVVDGDLSPLLKLPRLLYVGTVDKRHYNYKMHEFNELLEQKNCGGEHV